MQVSRVRSLIAAPAPAGSRPHRLHAAGAAGARACWRPHKPRGCRPRPPCALSRVGAPPPWPACSQIRHLAPLNPETETEIVKHACTSSHSDSHCTGICASRTFTGCTARVRCSGQRAAAPRQSCGAACARRPAPAPGAASSGLPACSGRSALVYLRRPSSHNDNFRNCLLHRSCVPKQHPKMHADACLDVPLDICHADLVKHPSDRIMQSRRNCFASSVQSIQSR